MTHTIIDHCSLNLHISSTDFPSTSLAASRPAMLRMWSHVDLTEQDQNHCSQGCLVMAPCLLVPKNSNLQRRLDGTANGSRCSAATSWPCWGRLTGTPRSQASVSLQEVVTFTQRALINSRKGLALWLFSSPTWDIQPFTEQVKTAHLLALKNTDT